jgi:hypothetical protein
LSGQTLDDGEFSLLQKSLNYAVTPRAILIEDILTGVETAVQSLPVEMAEEARQENVRIMKSSSRDKNSDAGELPRRKHTAKVTLSSSSFHQQMHSFIKHIKC